MTRRALVIGAETEGLSGVRNDTATMSESLASRGFTVRVCEGADATRAGILDEYERLIRDSRDGDCAFVFYSGHGGIAQPTDATKLAVTKVAAEDRPFLSHADGSLPELQIIVPTDFSASVPSDARVITSAELAVLLARLTGQTRNAVFAADCCHASHLSRGAGEPSAPNGFVRKSLPHLTYLDIAAHLDRLRGAGLPWQLPHVLGNPDAVRLAACGVGQSAYEYPGRNGRRTGAFTESLCIALGEAGDAPVAWSTLLERVRNRVLLLTTSQRPEVEGPGGRLLFETEAAGRGGALPVVAAGSRRIALPAARLLGVQLGDAFTILPAGTQRSDRSTAIGVATVDRIDGAAAEARVAFRRGHDAIPLGASALPLRTGAPRMPVAVLGACELADALRTAVDAAPLLRTVGDDETAVIAAVTVAADGGITIVDGAGPLAAPFAANASPVEPAVVGRTVEALTRLARAATLRTLAPTEREQLTDAFTVEWGRVVDGRPLPLPPAGGTVRSAEHIYLRLRNDSGRDLFFCVCDVGVCGTVSIVTSSDHSGVRVPPGHEHLVGRRELGGELVGLQLRWPAGVPTVGPRPEGVQVIVTSQPQDLSALEQDGARDAAQRPDVPGDGSSLSRLLAHLSSGTTRERRSVDPDAVRFAVRRIDLLLSPPSASDGTAPVRA